MRWMDRMNERAALMGRMMETIGATDKIPQSLVAESELRQAANRCLCCEKTEECAAWLKSHQDGAQAAPELCPNANLFAAWKDAS